jgi:hypothetical protein
MLMMRQSDPTGCDTWALRIRMHLFAAIAAMVLWSGCAPTAPAKPVAPSVKPPKFSPVLKTLLDENDRQYDADAQMLVADFRSPGYYTRIASGTAVHPTRESLIYALALLQRNAAGDTDRAVAIIRKVVGLQDTNSVSKTYGVWPWLLEEPLVEMESPDLNWADFCGSQIAHMLMEHPGKLPGAMRKSLRHAVRAIRRRNVGPGYTNIAVLGGSVCVVAGELFDDAELLAYGRGRLQGVVRHVQRHGGFSEYNSPPYSKVIIGECERLLHLARDPASRKAAESLRRTCWQDIAASFHPATQQWAGPHSRTSRVYLQPSTVEFLSLRTGEQIRTHPTMTADVARSRYATVPPLDCPSELVSRFQNSVEQPQQVRRVFARQVGSGDYRGYNLAHEKRLSGKCEPFELLDAAETADCLLEDGGRSGRRVSRTVLARWERLRVDGHPHGTKRLPGTLPVRGDAEARRLASHARPFGGRCFSSR